MGIWRDLKVEQRKTGVDEQVAKIVAVGREKCVPTPVNEAILDVVHEVEKGRRALGWKSLREISRRSGARAEG